MGKESFPLVKMWEDAGDLRRTTAEGAVDARAPGKLPEKYFTQLDEYQMNNLNLGKIYLTLAYILFRVLYMHVWRNSVSNLL